jgi:hypothetical protein
LEKPPTVRRDGDLCDKCLRAAPGLHEAPEEHREVLRTARALLVAGVTQEDVIYRTIVCAAWASADPDFRRMRDSVLEAGEQSERWEEMYHRFAYAFDSLEPWSIQDGVLLVRRPLVDVWAMRADDRGLTEEVLIEVRDRSATGGDVSMLYEKCLSRHGLSHIMGRGVLAFYVVDDSLQMLARPEQEESFHPELRQLVRTKKEQGKFPDPRDVGDFYEMLRAKGYLRGRRGGASPRHYNLIPACAAWYVGGRQALAADKTERRQLLADAETLVAKHVLEADTGAVPIKIRSTLKRDLEAAAQQIRDLEAEIRRGRVFLNTNLEDL